MNNVEKIESTVAVTASDSVPSEAEVRDLVGQLRVIFPITEEEHVRLIRRLHARLSIKMEEGAMLQAEYRPWLRARSAEITPFFWTRYRDFLLKKGWSSPVVATLGQVTDDILDSMGDPAKEGPWTRRGLVIGDVQSGKTSTYTALISKAADAGYPIIVLLTGTLENLRQQTQERLDEGFVGLASSDFLQRNPISNRSARFIGVGKINPEKTAAVFTSVASDFKAATMNQFNFRLASMRDPILLVVKKNKSVLENLRNWLRDFNAVNGKIDHPLLLLDDEADNASVNTNAPDTDPTQINRLIRELLALFSRNSYVGFTATPFANIFINPDSPEEMENDDLFPGDFIYTLEPPSNYLGARRIFGDTEDHESIVREITDAEEVFPAKHKSTLVVKNLPESLLEAIRVFLLATTIRDLRGEGGTHRSMLVNVSRFTAVQMQVQELILAYVEDVKQDIRNYAAEDPGRALRNPRIADLDRTFIEEFGASEFTWERVQKNLHQSVAAIEVRAVNQRTRAASLNYSSRRDTGLRVIAVGGNSLSRGLTIEGLSTSYFYRNSQMYDTLMQMGRWFGYRDGYEDLCRLWMSDEAEGWYAHISDASDELRNEVKTMMRRNMTPREFGLRVRAHPDALLVTAQNKMRLGETIAVDISLNEAYQETTRLRRNRNALQANEDAIKAFLRQINEASYPLAPSPLGSHRNFLRVGVPKFYVANLLSNFVAHPLNLNFSPELAEFVGSTNEERLQTWDVVLVNADNDEPEFDLEGYRIRPVARYVQSDESSIRIGSKYRVGTPGLEREGLPVELVEEIRRDHKGAGRVQDSEYRALRSRPLLLIYAVTPYKVKVKGGGLQDQLDIGVGHLYALALSFPRFDDSGIAKKVKYRVNLVEYRSLVESSLGDETEIDVTENVDED